MNSRVVLLQNLRQNQELNERMAVRNVPGETLQPNFSIRPTPTRYVTMPIVDLRTEAKETLKKHPKYDVEKTFNPGTRNAPWQGYADNVDTETVLRGTIFPLQGADQSKYMPSSRSDLYNFQSMENSNPVSIKTPLLFRQTQFNNFNPNEHESDVGFKFFENHTRQQTRNISTRSKPAPSD
tara:strand:- start:8 stop:550 length:543 start_codon:yes stop_codon:yes gene_type:complete